jgi:hypothetical protein
MARGLVALPAEGTETKLATPAQSLLSAQRWNHTRIWFAAHRRTSSLAFCATLYLFLTLITTADFLADTVDYAHSIVLRTQGRYYEFWEFGHVLWRPLGWAISSIFAMASPAWLRADVAHYNVIGLLIVISWLAGFATLYLFHRVAWRLTGDFWLASLGTVGFATAQAFLDFVQAGTAYIPGLAMLMLSIYILEVHYQPDHGARAGIFAGVALAGAALFWFPYLLAAPAVVMLPMVRRRGLRSSAVVAISFSVAMGVAYLAVILVMGLHRPGEILAWMRAASHGIETSGLKRALFGFARSFINMGREGMLFKRYLLHDPFAPVSLANLLRLVLIKLLLFYAALAAAVATLVLTRRWEALVVLLAALVPVFLFGVKWQGGDMERYLPLYPFFFLAIAICLTEHRTRFQRPVIMMFLAVMVLVNAFALSRSRLHVEEEQTARRVSEIPPAPVNIVYVTHNGDDFLNFSRSFPFAEVNRRAALRVRNVLEAGHRDMPLWRTTFARGVLNIWNYQGNVWVSKRLFSPVPKPEWNWVEGDDPRVSWKDLSPFFTRLQYESCVGGDDGFCRLAPSSINRDILAGAMPPTK